MNENEAVLRAYFRAWLEKDAAILPSLFAEDAVYSECYGPEYRGRGQILRWFADWNARGAVLVWTIKDVLREGDRLAAEWYFCCEYEGKTGGFDGVTLARFDAAHRIVALKEFQSNAEHRFPYGNGLLEGDEVP